METFDNFAVDVVLRHGHLDTRTRLMIQLASMIASQALSEYRVMLSAALTVGVTPVEIKEIVYARLIDVLTQLLPFICYPRTLNGLRAIDEVAPA